jgi:hypothetical protein
MPEIKIKSQAQYFEGAGGYLWWKGSLEEGQLRQEGWKLHIGATPENAQRIADKVLGLLVSGKVAHKLLPRTEWLSDGRSQDGKFIAIYPKSIEDAFAILQLMDHLLVGFSAPSAQGERLVGKSKMISTRYGGFEQDKVMRNNKLEPWLGRGSKIHPEWIQDPWDHYPNAAAVKHIAPWPNWTGDWKRG